MNRVHVPRPPSSPRTNTRQSRARRPVDRCRSLAERLRNCPAPAEPGTGNESRCFLCHEDKWKYERPEIKRHPKVKKNPDSQASDGLYSLMSALSKVCKHRNGDSGARGADLWTWLLEPLRNLVPCEEVKFVVRSLGLPATPQLPFSHDAEVGVSKFPNSKIFAIFSNKSALYFSNNCFKSAVISKLVHLNPPC